MKHHQLPTYTTMVRMRGKSPEEVVVVMTDNVREAEEALEKERQRQKDLTFQVEKIKLRCERVQVGWLVGRSVRPSVRVVACLVGWLASPCR